MKLEQFFLLLLISTRFLFFAVILRSLRLVYLVVTLSVMLLDSWYFDAKYANYLRNCYNQFLWSLPFLLNWLIRLLFNVIIVDLLQPIRLVFQVVPLQSLVNSYLVSYLCFLTFFQPLQLIVVVVDFCLNFLSAMLNACVISSFKRLVSLVVCPIS